MSRIFRDALDVEWEVFVEPVDDPTDTVDEEVVLHFVPDDDSDEREIRAVGPVEEMIGTLTEEDLALALEAAGNEIGFVYLHPEGHLWWVRRGDEDPTAEGAALTFSDTEDEFQYGGMLAGEPSTLTEEELQEILDEARGVTSP